MTWPSLLLPQTICSCSSQAPTPEEPFCATRHIPSPVGCPALLLVQHWFSHHHANSYFYCFKIPSSCLPTASQKGLLSSFPPTPTLYIPGTPCQFSVLTNLLQLASKLIATTSWKPGARAPAHPPTSLMRPHDSSPLSCLVNVEVPCCLGLLSPLTPTHPWGSPLVPWFQVPYDAPKFFIFSWAWTLNSRLVGISHSAGPKEFLTSPPSSPTCLGQDPWGILNLSSHLKAFAPAVPPLGMLFPRRCDSLPHLQVPF